MIGSGEDPRECGPQAPPYTCGDLSPAVFMGETDHVSLFTLSHCEELETIDLVLIVLRAAAWSSAKRAAGLDDWGGWYGVALDELEACGVPWAAGELIIELLDECFEWGTSLRVGWLDDRGWRVLWGYEVTREIVADELREWDARRGPR